MKDRISLAHHKMDKTLFRLPPRRLKDLLVWVRSQALEVLQEAKGRD